MNFINVHTTSFVAIVLLLSIILFAVIAAYKVAKPMLIEHDIEHETKLKMNRLKEAGSSLYLSFKLEAESTVKDLNSKYYPKPFRSKIVDTGHRTSYSSRSSSSSAGSDDLLIGVVAGAVLFG